MNDDLLRTLAEIRDYFLVCLGNADPRSAQHERFSEFISAIVVAAGVLIAALRKKKR